MSENVTFVPGTTVHRVPGVRARVRRRAGRAGERRAGQRAVRQAQRRAGARRGGRRAARRLHGVGAAAAGPAAASALHRLHTRHLQVRVLFIFISPIFICSLECSMLS